MKITAVLHKEYPGLTPAGGAGTMMRDLLEFLVREGWEAGVILRGSASDTDANSVHVTYAPDEAALARQLRGTDVIITHLGGTPFARRAGNKLGIPVAQLIHNTSEYSVGFLGSGCDLAIYNARWVADYHFERRASRLVKTWQGEGRSTVSRRSAGHWPSIIVRPPAVLPREGNYNRPDDAHVTLVNLVPNKGPDIFYALAERMPDVSFMGVRGGYESHLEVLRPSENVTIREHTPDVRSFYRDTSVLLVPSKYESYSRCAVEAMFHGIPVIGSNTPGLSECLGGWNVLPREDLDLWEEHLRKVLEDHAENVAHARRRYDYLHEQTKQDLVLFEQTMRDLSNGRLDPATRA